MVSHSPHVSIASILDNFDERVSIAQEILAQVCTHQKLTDLLGTVHSWAIVGGPVRDALLGNNATVLSYLSEINDLDIALAHLPETGPLGQPGRGDPQVHITTNHYGGMKVRRNGFVELDLWVWEAAYNRFRSRSFWFDKLASIDFGLNAAVFVWPTCDIFVHHRWKEDLEDLRIERLAQESLITENDPVRAVALAAKLELRLGYPLGLGPQTKKDLHWLLYEADNDKRNRAFSYLRSKLMMRRWPQYTLSRFIQICLDYGCPPHLTQELRALASDVEAL